MNVFCLLTAELKSHAFLQSPRTCPGATVNIHVNANSALTLATGMRQQYHTPPILVFPGHQTKLYSTQRATCQYQCGS